MFIVKLLFDHNLSPRLADYCTSLFADSTHVFKIGLDQAEDLKIWEYARINSFTIVTKDSDFNHIVSFFGFPPKVIWIKKGNCTTNQIKLLITDHLEDIRAFIIDQENGILVIN